MHARDSPSHSPSPHSPSLGATTTTRPVTVSEAKGVDRVRLCVERYPEILWLADEHVRVTEEARATSRDSYSEQLFGKKYIEFDRTVMTLHCLKLILDGGDDAYRQFTAAQPERVRLTGESFKALHRQGRALLTSGLQGMSESEMMRAMEAALVLGDIGKSARARELFKAYGAQAPDHDDFYGEVVRILQKKPDLCPTFGSLTSGAQKLITRAAHLVHYGHITHMEGGPDMFSELRKSGVAVDFPLILTFSYFIHICDVAGASGHVNRQSSLAYTEPSHLAIRGVLESCGVLANPDKTEKDAYDAYLAVRASWLGFGTRDRTDRVLTRMGAMLRLFTPEEGAVLRAAVATLSPGVQSRIIEQLDVGGGEEPVRTPTYMPAMLINLANNPRLGVSREERLSRAVILGFPFIARVLRSHRERLARLEADPATPLCFNGVAGVAKTDPDALGGEYRIDPEGNVRLSGMW
ncbi:MAG: hypothetical protein OXF02_03990 [Simkaniaceae bacterium]|nr:hypothetical protein [Simkaniaceae bacterium]